MLGAMPPITVLVADDDALARRCFVEMLGSLGVRATAVAGGAEALAALERTPFDVLIADLRMPGPAGPELATAVGRRLGARAPRLYATSGELGPDSRARLLAAGYADALEKPVARAALAALLGLDTNPELSGASGADGEAARSPPVLDDAAALAALGSDGTVAAMRALMRDDLPGQRSAMRADLAAGRREAAAGALHRMRAACGFCGAPRLSAASAALQRALELGAAVEALGVDWDVAAGELEAALAQR